MDKNIIKVNFDQKFSVDARELWQKLGSKRQFNNWIKQRIEKYGFTPEEDFTRFNKFVKTDRSASGTQKTKEYSLTIGMAKELCMLENTEAGRKFRKYFVRCEEKLTKMIANQQNNLITARTEGKKARLNFTDAIKEYVEYCKANGSKNANNYYHLFTTAMNKRLFNVKSLKNEKKNLRDYIDVHYLITISAIELTMRNRIFECLEKEMEYHQIYKEVVAKIDELIELIGIKRLDLQNSDVASLERKQD